MNVKIEFVKFIKNIKLKEKHPDFSIINGCE